MELLSKIGRPLGIAAGMMLSGAMLAGCVAAPYPPDAGPPPPGYAGGPPPGAGPAPEYAQNTGPQGGGYYNPPSGGYGPPSGGGYGGPAAEGYGPPSGEGYGPPPGEGYGSPGGGYGPPPGGGGYGYGGPAAEGYGPPPGGGYGGQGMTREEFIARARHRAVVHGRDPELAARHAARRFVRIDTDHNGVIERPEMEAWRAAHAHGWRAQGGPPAAGYPPSGPANPGY